MMKPPLDLKYSFPKKIDLSVNLDNEVASEITTRCDLKFAQNKANIREWQVSLGVHIEGKNTHSAYFGYIEYLGLFQVADDYPEKKINQLVAITAPSILYGAIRELVAFLTGRGPHRSLMLPTVTFQGTTLQNADSKPRANK